MARSFGTPSHANVEAGVGGRHFLRSKQRGSGALSATAHGAVWVAPGVVANWSAIQELLYERPHAFHQAACCLSKDPVIISQTTPPREPSKRWDDHPNNFNKALQQDPGDTNTSPHHSKRTLNTFCHKCWSATDFRHNATHVEDMTFMHDAGIFKEKIIIPGKRLRGKINEEAFHKCIDTYLKTSVAPGQGALQNEHIKSMSDDEKEILRQNIRPATNHPPEQHQPASQPHHQRKTHRRGRTKQSPRSGTRRIPKRQ